jgi:pimeloyl-ACP methyl ester carboxylesterase
MATVRPVDDAGVNRAAARRDLAAARAAGDEERAALLEALLADGSLLLYRPERDHYGLQLGDLGSVHHVAVLVPGVGTDVHLRAQWLPSAHHLFDAAGSTTVILWKGYDEPSDVLEAAARTIACDSGVVEAAAGLAAFVASLPLGPTQTLTVVAHSFGSVVTGAALAHHGLECTAVVVAGSPGMTVDVLRQLHLDDDHFFTEEAPGDPVAALGVFGAEPTSPSFGGTRMRTNAPGHVEVRAHSEYFVPGSESLENIVDVVTGRYDAVEVHRSSLAESVGGLVSWALRLPTLPVAVVARVYRGPGFRALVNTRQLADLSAAQAGNAVRDGLDASGRAVAWAGHRLTGPAPDRGDGPASVEGAAPTGPDEPTQEVP